MEDADGRLDARQQLGVGVDVEPGGPVLHAGAQLAHACHARKIPQLHVVYFRSGSIGAMFCKALKRSLPCFPHASGLFRFWQHYGNLPH